jgi:hypothetical protein
MQNKKITSVILLSISTLMAVFFFQDQIIGWKDQVELSLLVGIAAIASGVSGVLMSLSSRKVAIFEAIREYYQNGDTPAMIENRTKIYATEDGVTPLDEKAASEICAYFHFWGMMVKKGYLPIWVFNSASGPSVVRLFYLLKPYIELRRVSNNQYYAKDFEYLIKYIEKKYKIRYSPPTRDGVISPSTPVIPSSEE